MEDIQAAIPRQRYLIVSYTLSNEEDDDDWFALEIRLNGKNFTIGASASDFRDSPSKTRQFYEHLACLRADGNEDYEDIVRDEDAGTESEPKATVSDCFDWAVDPNLGSFESLAPPPTEGTKLTLQHFFRSESYECQLRAIDDVFVLGTVERCDQEPDGALEPGFGGETAPTSWTTTFPSFHASQIEVICDEWDGSYNILDADPVTVSVASQIFFFKPVQPAGDIFGKNEVKTYEQIAHAGFAPDVRIPRLHGVAVNDNAQLLGLLLQRIDEADTLEYMLGPDTPDPSKQRWAQQIKTTLGALHERNIFWGDAKADNVIIDVSGDAWIVDFGGGHTRGWVDRDKSGTIAGDLQGLENILKFIATGGREDRP